MPALLQARDTPQDTGDRHFRNADGAGKLAVRLLGDAVSLLVLGAAPAALTEIGRR